MKYLLLILSLTLLVGCGRTVDQVDLDKASARNARQLNSDGLYIGILPDGREVRGYQVVNPYDQYYHWIYVVKGANSQTTNRTAPSGKYTRLAVEATIGE